MALASPCFGGFRGILTLDMPTYAELQRTPNQARAAIEKLGRLKFGDPDQIRDIQILEDAARLIENGAENGDDGYGYGTFHENSGGLSKSKWRERVMAMTWNSIREAL